MKIVSIKKTGKKYKIELDNKSKIATYDDVIINNGLLYKKEVDANLLNKINIDNNYYDVYNKLVNTITKRIRSEKEINEMIDKFSIDDKSREEIIKKLKSINLINDEAFTKAYISDHINLSNDGPFKIKKELINHNIDVNVIDKYLIVDEEILKDKIKKLINKKIKNSKYTGFYLKQKVVEYLVNLGYDSSLSSLVYDTFEIKNTNLLEDEYNKLFKKYSNKYDEKELKTKIKQKLYQKGFTISEINNFLERI